MLTLRSAPRTLAAAGLVALATGCAPDEPPPVVNSGWLEAAIAAERPQLVVSALGAMPTPMPAQAPMPMAESIDRSEESSKVGVAIANTAAHVADRPLLAAFNEGAANELALEPIACSDRDAIALLTVGKAEFAVIRSGLGTRDLQAGLRAVRLGVELFALTVTPNSPVRSLTHHQVRQVFTGQVTHWQQLGYDGGAIVPVVPSDRNEADRAAQALIAGDSFASTCVRVSSERHVVDQLLREPGAIGVVRITGQPREGEQRLLAIDWQLPTLAAFDAGSYPFGTPVHLVTMGPAVGIARRFLEFSQAAGGRELLARALSLPE